MTVVQRVTTRVAGNRARLKKLLSGHMLLIIYLFLERAMTYNPAFPPAMDDHILIRIPRSTSR